MIGLEWIGQKWFIACLISMTEEILSAEPCDVLLDHPEPQPVPKDVNILNIGVNPYLVYFIYQGKIHITSHSNSLKEWNLKKMKSSSKLIRVTHLEPLPFHLVAVLIF